MLHIILFVETSGHSAHLLDYAENQLLQRVTETSRMFRKEIVFLSVFVNGINCFCIHFIPPHKYLRYAHTVSAVSHCAPSNLSVPAFLSCFPSVPVHGMNHRYDTSAKFRVRMIRPDISRFHSVISILAIGHCISWQVLHPFHLAHAASRILYKIILWL